MSNDDVFRLERDLEQKLGEVTARRSLRAVFEAILAAKHFDSASGSHPPFVTQFQEKLQARLAEAVEQGELPEFSDVSALSYLAVSFSMGLMECARAGLARDALKQAAELAIEQFGFQKERGNAPRRRQGRL